MHQTSLVARAEVAFRQGGCSSDARSRRGSSRKPVLPNGSRLCGLSATASLRRILPFREVVAELKRSKRFLRASRAGGSKGRAHERVESSYTSRWLTPNRSFSRIANGRSTVAISKPCRSRQINGAGLFVVCLMLDADSWSAAWVDGSKSETFGGRFDPCRVTEWTATLGRATQCG
jgi:hypothetical protein